MIDISCVHRSTVVTARPSEMAVKTLWIDLPDLETRGLCFEGWDLETQSHIEEGRP